jgi:uracil-DNA glycosylase family 4
MSGTFSIVPGQGPWPARLLIIGEHPGEVESKTGVPFHPRAVTGNELTRYLRWVLGWSRQRVFLTNLCLKVVENRSGITEKDIDEEELSFQLSMCQPEVIMTLGRMPTQRFLGKDVDLGEVIGLPHYFTSPELIRPAIVIPNHLRMYEPDLQPQIWYAFDQARKVLEGELLPPVWESPDATYIYLEATSTSDVDWLHHPPLIAVDTEGLKGNPWGLSFSNQPRRAHVIRVNDRVPLFEFRRQIEHSRVILHNSLHDLAVLRDMQVTVTNFDDTMVMASLLRVSVVGLKELAYQHRGLRRESYLEVIGPASRELALDWLEKIADHDWGPSAEELYFEDEEPRIYSPQSLNRRIEGILGVHKGEILSTRTRDKKEMTALKKELTALGITVGRYNKTRTGWIECRTPRKAYAALTGANAPPDIIHLFPDPKTAKDPRKRWEDVEEDLPDQTGAAALMFGAMPEAGLDALETVFGPEGRKKATNYSAGDADDTWVIYPILKQRIEDMGLTDAYNLDIAVIPMVDRMMHIGFKVDAEYFKELGRDLEIEKKACLAQIRKEIGYDLNPNSPLQVANLLFSVLKMPVQRYNPDSKQPSTDDTTIEALRMLDNNPVLALIADYRELSKMKGTYTDRLGKWMKQDGRIHPKLRITGVPSGRLACSEPNLMAIPARSQREVGGKKLGKAIRDGFVAKDGCVLGSWDLDQIEMRVLAHRSEDPTLINIFLSGEDIHQKTASLVFGLPMDQVGKGTWQRDSAKSIGFGIVYGLTSQGLQGQMKLRGIDRSEVECKAMIDAYLVDAYPGVRRLMEEKKSEARQNAYVRSMFGRIRYLPAMNSFNNRLRSETERVCLNHDIQTTAQEIFKFGMKGIWERVLPQLWSESHYIEPILQIHDELIFEMDEDIADVADVLIRNELQEAVKLMIPIGAKGAFAKTWGGLK